MSAQLYSAFDVTSIYYSPEVVISKNTGAKNAYLSIGTAGGDKVRFQMGTGRGDHMRAVYGVSTPFQGAETNRRGLDLSIDTPEQLAFFEALDAQNKAAAAQRSHEWFKKQLTPDQIDAFYVPTIKPASKAEFTPTARCKLSIETTQVFVVTGESADGQFECQPGGWTDIARGSKVVPILESSMIWFGPNQFGMTLLATHLLVWPGARTMGIGAFSLPVAPKLVAAAPAPVAPVVGAPTTFGTAAPPPPPAPATGFFAPMDDDDDVMR